jgi:hypothetical protein
MAVNRALKRALPCARCHREQARQNGRIVLTGRLQLVPSERPTPGLGDVRLQSGKQVCVAGARHARRNAVYRGPVIRGRRKAGPMFALGGSGIGTVAST